MTQSATSISRLLQQSEPAALSCTVFDTFGIEAYRDFEINARVIHPVNLCMMWTLLKSVDLALTVWVSLHSRLHMEHQNSYGKVVCVCVCVLQSFKVTEIESPCASTCYYKSIWDNKDLTKSCVFRRFYPPHAALFEALAREVPLDGRYPWQGRYPWMVNSTFWRDVKQLSHLSIYREYYTRC